MTSTKLSGNPVSLAGDFPIKGAAGPNFSAVTQDLSEISLDHFKGKKKVLNIFPVSTRMYARHPFVNSTKKPRPWKTPG